MAAVPFQHIPSNIRVPLFYAEVSNADANSASANQNTLLIGQITSAGVAPAGIPLLSQGPTDAQTQGGQNSMLAIMAAAYFANDSGGTVYYLPLADDGSSVKATGSIVVSASPTAAGMISLYIADVLISLPVTAGQTTASIATALQAQIAATPNLPVTAGVSSSTVTLTAVNGGLLGNDIQIATNYLGAQGNQVTPTGLGLTITAMANGAVNPTAGLTTALANLGNTNFDFIICPYTDSVSLGLIQSFLNDSTGRWSYSQQLYGHCFTALRGTLGTLATFGATQNNQHTSVMGFYGSPTWTPSWAAAVGGACASSLRVDPALPLQTVQVNNVLTPQLPQQFDIAEQNTLLYEGISTFSSIGGQVALQNLITTYQTNAFGAPDNSYLEVETLFTLMYVLRDMRGIITSKFARMKLAANGTTFAAGAAVVTPNTIRAELIAEYNNLESQGYVQDSSDFAANLVVQQNTTNPNRVDVLWPGTLINQLRVFAALFQFRL